MGTPFASWSSKTSPSFASSCAACSARATVEVECAATGTSMASSWPARTVFDLILLDVVLPSARRHHRVRMLKADATLTAKVPLHMLTAKAKKSDVEVAMKAGATGYIHKPFRGADLMDLVSTLRAKKG
jgi:two-component system phosphate regulon response regulator PhoB